MKIGKIYKSLILLGLFLTIKPSLTISQPLTNNDQKMLMSDMVLQIAVIVLGIVVLMLLIFMIIQRASGSNWKRLFMDISNRVEFLEEKHLKGVQQSRPQVSSSLPRHNEVNDDKLKQQFQELTEKFEALNKKVYGILQPKLSQISYTDKNDSNNIRSERTDMDSIQKQDQDDLSEPIILSIPQQQEFVADCLTGGAFQDLRPVSRRDRRTPYIISKRENEYYFRLDETNSDAIATSIQHRDSYVDGFCESLNNYFPGAKSFTQESKLGKLQLVEDKLQVVEKIKIRYS